MTCYRHLNVLQYTVNPGYSAPGFSENFFIVKIFDRFEKGLQFILALYILWIFGYSGEILSSGRVSLYRGLTVG